YRSGKPLDDAEVKSAIDAGEKRLNGHGRLLVRSSGTEPVIRVMGECDDRILVEEVVDHIVTALGQAAAGSPIASQPLSYGAGRGPVAIVGNPCRLRICLSGNIP